MVNRDDEHIPIFGEVGSGALHSAGGPGRADNVFMVVGNRASFFVNLDLLNFCVCIKEHNFKNAFARLDKSRPLCFMKESVKLRTKDALNIQSLVT